MLKCDYSLSITPALGNVMNVGKFGNTATSGLVFKEITNVNLCSLRITTKAQEKSEAELSKTFELALPDINSQNAKGDVSVSWVAKDEYLLKTPRNKLIGEIIEKFKQSLSDIAITLDKSHSFCLLEISGENVVDLLEKAITLDLRDSSFPVGSSTSTIMTHNRVIIQRVDQDRYHIYLPRTHAYGVWKWLVPASEEFGYEIVS